MSVCYDEAPYVVPPDVAAAVASATDAAEIDVKIRNQLYAALGRHIPKAKPAVLAFHIFVETGAHHCLYIYVALQTSSKAMFWGYEF